MHNHLKTIRSTLYHSIDTTPERIAAYFKTGKGDYAEHDHFIGVTVPTLRKIAKSYKKLPLGDIAELLQSKFNEERLLALIILVLQYQNSMTNKSDIFNIYIQYLNYVNNWNLVDSSAYQILGAHLWNKDRGLLLELANSKSLWERRISIVATWYFIKRQDYDDTIKISKALLGDKHDLIHKAVGWMLREMGKQNQNTLENFLRQYKAQMPRTMLRYAIEKLPEYQRQGYLSI